MLYYFFGYLDKVFDFPGARMFQYISFRAGMAVIVSLIISMILGKSLINLLKKMQVKESIRDLGLEGQKEKEGTPTMGGLIILGAILIPTLLFADLTNIYIIIILITTIWLGFIGFIDDYIMVFKKDKKGLAAKFKILGQVTLGLFVGLMMYYHPDIVIRERTSDISFIESIEKVETDDLRDVANDLYSKKNIKSTKSTIPFFKNNELDYSIFVSWLGKDYQRWTIIVFVAVVILIITLISNSANLTDGIDGLATGVSAIIGSTLAVLAYVSGNIFFANYLNIMYLPDSGELVIFIAAFVGACIGFLWYNTFPAQVFMGDTGSLALGGIIAVFAIMLRKELLIPLLCGIFLAESASVVMQVSYFKYTKRKYGAGKRIFKMSPLHHHYQLKGYAEPKIVQRFFIVGIMLAVFTVITLKIR
ncbi:MAG: phospho-N-acetylmuramoyl-pentapeptide-transferase [Bacteroidales bacterium]|jgi:phospho-N-acetylmuramoyl-pentapeptide-transferase|nr:phospho-N-acetylmuramoyl-pentapeptide-transferase [Bacteroidales bacterium]MDI9593387.1 phospho-N-acetylmuramoyl-pentapeptide-transferase [Bacteroidota bacterium]NLH33577.1 phospho-N-acetylmuramoyl-pentapeptide-transferase [Lentimicrobium sp.]OQC36586.1 MAG: Phospho-N-acetylmuramoyl-pentapeptide-transferase [Bacteroidetes bacterium ADurb.Bin041]MBP7874548.1 phospho-N-acetylmuramoyl-pentapeptide-transferase [Bacteroidales bacterium]